jgi:PAS domain S-box-containing protein
MPVIEADARRAVVQVGQSPVLAWRVTVASSAIALVLAQALRTVFEPLPFIPFLGAVAVSAWYGGLWPGALATLFGLAAGVGLLSPGAFQGDDTPLFVARLASFLLLAVLITWPIARLRRAHARQLAAGAALAADRARLLRDGQVAQAQAHALFNGVLDALLLIDADGRYLDANAAASALLGYSHDEFARMRIGDLPALGPGWSEAERAHFVRNGYWRGEMQLQRKDGRLVPVDVRISAVVLPTETIYLAALRDMSLQRALDSQPSDLLVRISLGLQRRLAALRAEDTRH